MDQMVEIAEVGSDGVERDKAAELRWWGMPAAVGLRWWGRWHRWDLGVPAGFGGGGCGQVGHEGLGVAAVWR